MLLERLREEVLKANLELVRRGLVLYTFGNVSGLDREQGLVAIKPSGVPYEEMQPGDMVVTDMAGKVVEGTLRPSSDLATHLVLYHNFPGICGVAHTHSEFATAWAQSGRSVPCLGTTHADYFRGPVPVTEYLSEGEIASGYEELTGNAICRAFADKDPNEIPGALVRGHGPFCWGLSAMMAARNAVILEAVARMAYFTVVLAQDVESLPLALHEKHFLRKHGIDAYYGQATKKP